MPIQTDLSHDFLQAKLGDGWKVCLFEETDSTNLQAKKLRLAGESRPCLLIADRQTGGKGRLGKSFHSPSGTGLYMTLLFSEKRNPESVLSLTAAMSVAVMRAIRKLTGIQTQIKWVNDLFCRGKKVCGILTEFMGNDSDSAFIIGVGINLRPAEFPAELSAIAGTLNHSTLPRQDLALQIIKEFLPYWENPTDASWLSDYKQYSLLLGKQIQVICGGISTPAIALDFTDRGFLKVRYEDGREETVSSGEVSIRL